MRAERKQNSRKEYIEKRCRGCGEPLAQRINEQLKDWRARSSCGRGCHAAYKGAIPVWQRFQRCAVQVSSGCIEWTGNIDADGYGRIETPKEVLAHRVSYLMHRGSIPDGMLICHRCDNRRCVNPHHLFLGTCQDNVDDMVRKGRSADVSGTNNPNWRHGRYVEGGRP